jgi:hypothetical protein
VTKGKKIALVLFLGASLLPIWRSGLRENMNLWQWVNNHTIFGPASEYVPEEYYLPTRPIPLQDNLSEIGEEWTEKNTTPA